MNVHPHSPGSIERSLASRREFLARSTMGLGGVALSGLLNPDVFAARIGEVAPRAKRIIFLFMSGGPSHVDLFDPKPLLRERDGEEMPPEIIQNHVFAMIKSARPLIRGSPYRFSAVRRIGHRTLGAAPSLIDRCRRHLRCSLSPHRYVQS